MLERTEVRSRDTVLLASVWWAKAYPAAVSDAVSLKLAQAGLQRKETEIESERKGQSASPGSGIANAADHSRQLNAMYPARSIDGREADGKLAEPHGGPSLRGTHEGAAKGTCQRLEPSGKEVNSWR